MADIPIGLQLYSIRDDAKDDLPGVLKQVADMGYAGVEFAGLYGHEPADVRKMLDDLGLSCFGTHSKFETIQGEQLAETIELHRTLGTEYIMVPSVPPDLREGADNWRKLAELFSAQADKAAEAGMKLGYHNHAFEFAAADGEGTLLDVFLKHSDDRVLMQIDTGNALHGGADPAPFIRNYPGRFESVHLKEYDPGNDKALIGEGKVDWPDVFEAAESAGGVRVYIVEQESYGYPPLECVDRCLKALRGMGK